MRPLDNDPGTGTDVTFDIDSAVDSISSDVLSTEKTTTADDGGTPAPVSGDRPREDNGRFAKKVADPAAPAPTAATDPTKKVELGADNKVTQTPADPNAPAPAATDPSAQQAGLAAPKTWGKDAIPFWGQIPARAQAEIHKREQDMFRGLQQYREAATVGHTFTQALAPFLEHFQREGVNPAEMTKRALTAHLNLTLSPIDVKVRLFKEFARDYGIPLDMVMADEPYVSPEVQGLNAQIEQMRGTINGMAQRFAQQNRERVQSSVDAFADDPKNIYFEELGDDIARLISTGAAPDLPTAYEQAIWLNPAVRAKEIARQATEKKAQQDAEAAERAAKAKQATAANVRSQTHPTAVPVDAPTGDMGDTIEAKMREIRARG